MIINLKNKSYAISRKADRIAMAHGCQILPDSSGRLHLDLLAQNTGGAWGHGHEDVAACEKALGEAGCIKGVVKAPKAPVQAWAVYRKDTGDPLSRHRSLGAAQAAAARLGGAPERAKIGRARGHFSRDFLQVGVAVGAGDWRVYHPSQGDQWAPCDGWEIADQRDE